MKNIFNSYIPLRPYFKDTDFTKIFQSKNPFFEALALFDVNFALDYLKNTDPESIESFSVKVVKKIERGVLANIKSYKSFSKTKQLTIDKNNYLLKYPLIELLPSDPYEYMKMISVSSGSGGKPSFWPRGSYLELETTIIYELILKDFFQIDKKKTLLINAYSMGMYVAGVFTLNACLRIAQRGYNLSIINPGISIEDILRIISEIGRYYDQIIICGYPPFIKDVIDEGIRRKIKWPQYNLKFIFGAEAISEDWRSYLFDKVGVKDYYHSSMNTYGSADAAILAHETPFSILIKKICSEDCTLIKKIFGGKTVSTFAQYHPQLKYFETYNDELMFSAIAGLPLYKYVIHDEGRVYKFSEIIKIFNKEGIDLIKRAKEEKINIWHLPFIVLLGKSDETITLYGLNVYPQTIRSALEDKVFIDDITTRMLMCTKYNRLRNQYIEVQVEINKGNKPTKKLAKAIEKKIFNNLLKYNYEYKTLYEKVGNKVKPRIVLTKYGKLAIDRGKKQKWIQNQ